MIALLLIPGALLALAIALYVVARTDRRVEEYFATHEPPSVPDRSRGRADWEPRGH